MADIEDLGFAKRLEETASDQIHLVESFFDPLAKAPRLAAMEPVVIRGRQRQERETGWVVVVVDEQPAHGLAAAR